MAIESAADLLIFIQEDDFAVSAVYTPAGGAATTITGIFQDPQASRNLTERMDVSIPEVTFITRTVDIGGDAEGDNLVVSSVSYTIKAVVTDGTGMTTMMLEED